MQFNRKILFIVIFRLTNTIYCDIIILHRNSTRVLKIFSANALYKSPKTRILFSLAEISNKNVQFLHIFIKTFTQKLHKSLAIRE